MRSPELGRTRTCMMRIQNFSFKVVQQSGPVCQTKQKSTQKTSKPIWMNNLLPKAKVYQGACGGCEQISKNTLIFKYGSTVA